ncbi:hypothetical protein IAQ61_008212 [Plenodomus lingam]|uniref:uncharacterized protein n=1 Tax=Leptosphaeria maculans TaxID=5022 RepID=UPI003319466F|nr:hypothetical protein IAQ61_008212 [Plenodomus lingam]
MQERRSAWLASCDPLRALEEHSLTTQQPSFRAEEDIFLPSPTMSPHRPRSSMNSDLNKPLPPSPLILEKSNRKSSFRGFLRRKSPVQLQTMHLQPEPYPHRHSTSNTNPNDHYRHGYSRSMPSSPRGFHHSSALHDPNFGNRMPSATPHVSESVSHLTYPDRPNQTTYFHEQRPNSTSNYDTTTPSRLCTTLPSSNDHSTTRENVADRVRPHTWLSPTEPFTDMSQFHLFAEAMTGLPDDTESSSPDESPRLEGSLFARRSFNDTIPLPLQHPQESEASRRSPRIDSHNFEPPSYTTPQLAPGPISPASQQWQPSPHMQALRAELELLGLEDEHASDCELPNYAQSQAEMSAKKRAEASARARELEERWRNTRLG